VPDSTQNLPPPSPDSARIRRGQTAPSPFSPRIPLCPSPVSTPPLMLPRLTSTSSAVLPHSRRPSSQDPPPRLRCRPPPPGKLRHRCLLLDEIRGSARRRSMRGASWSGRRRVLVGATARPGQGNGARRAVAARLAGGGSSRRRRAGARAGTLQGPDCF
jgi:hypothetical protein